MTGKCCKNICFLNTKTCFGKLKADVDLLHVDQVENIGFNVKLIGLK